MQHLAKLIDTGEPYSLNHRAHFYNGLALALLHRPELAMEVVNMYSRTKQLHV